MSGILELSRLFLSKEPLMMSGLALFGILAVLRGKELLGLNRAWMRRRTGSCFQLV
jgi:hypothetical protein